ncbi:hypothetical protein QSH18_10905 [Xanthomonas sp. NCPPB 2654]|uniref:hypothetical protein n=1 Tax=unclassified Xanthomonas TaxID=2643310 RepID=UPI0021E01F1A|nr:MULTISPECIES: hypothetical protein [unclassified Xanthomonas]MDL5366115.1 hypothetical protein [Xanthomonas sp. NCPPB 2654]UYC20812.1 hypothetical protein NUG20_00405 [Xanthomonas sp. CFBP 8443]
MPIRVLSLFSLLLLGAVPGAQAAQKHCLPYGPIKVTLSGTLERARAAPHDHASAAPGDGAATREEVLVLPARLCVAPSADGRMAGHDEVRRLRLALSADQAAHLGEEGAGQIVRVTGMLSQVAAGEGEPALRLTVVGVDSD